ncbi:GNAT family N-acetyltransferase [Rhizobium leguminosarum]|uniref:GNAT family N-acetyltransferase n=1 Tax=Rhizobium leguminosarum TaxID=384 RepID=UPI0010396104|nr:GNAT family N-acetyltransferase [Rhizobium leguminosarum]TBY43667.1 N-acetyltransferase [Rhizobium leguminosarum bv. viciae]
MSAEIAIANLRNRADMLETAANRIWHAWSKHRGLTLKQVVQKLQRIKASDDEFTLIAHTGDMFVGTISLIKSDLVERSNLTPWIAAVWVENDFRKHRVGSALVKAAERLAISNGRDVLYLCCAPELRPFYSGLGWTEIETNIGKSGSCIFKRQNLKIAVSTDSDLC